VFFVHKVSVWMVFKPFFQTFLGDKLQRAHAVVPYKQWSGKLRPSVDSTGPLRYCNKYSLQINNSCGVPA
jgi:hypothetical protein